MPINSTTTPTPNYLTGQVVAVQLGGKLAYCMEGSADTEVAVIKRTNSKSGGYQEVRPGTKKASGELTLAYNGDDPPLVSEGVYGNLLIDTAGYEFSENQENQTTTGTGGTATTTNSAPTGELLTIPVMISKIARKWNADSGDYGWVVSYESSGAYTVVQSSGATPTT